MRPNEYLEGVLRDQTLGGDSDEMNRLREHRRAVEAILSEAFTDSPTIRYGGSKAKGTMIKQSYDLDIACYFEHDAASAGETLEEIYNNVEAALAPHYATERKTSAIRLRDRADLTDFHIDVVPGRFVSDDHKDVFLHQSSGDKKRLKTNLDVHIAYIRDSGVIDAIRLMKLWAVRNRLGVKTFVLELLVVDLLKANKTDGLDAQLRRVLEQFRDNAEQLSVEDPANPFGNDLTGLIATSRSPLQLAAKATLELLENAGWEAVFGKIDQPNGGTRVEALGRIAATVPAHMRSRPWTA